MLCDVKACFKAVLVVILLFSLFNVATMAMPTDTTPALWIMNSSNASGMTILEPGNSLADGNWIVLDGGNTIRIPGASFHYHGPDVLNGNVVTNLLSDIPFLSGFGIGTTYEISNASPHDVTVPFDTYHVYVEGGSKSNVVANFHGSLNYANSNLNIKLLDLTKVSDMIDFTNLSTIKSSAKTLTLDDIRNSEIQSVDVKADSSGDIQSIQSDVTKLNGMSQGYYLLMIVDDQSDPTVPCIVAETPIIVTKSDMTVDLPIPGQPGDSLSFYENVPAAGSGTFTYVTAIIPEANYSANVTFTTSGTLEGSKIDFDGFGLVENATIHSDGTPDGTTVGLKGIGMTLSKSDLDDATLMRDTLMKEVNNSNIALGIKTTTSSSDVNVVVPTRDTMPMGDYIVLAAAVDRNTGRIVAINQTTVSMGYSMTYNLVEYWNLISVPLNCTDNNIEDFFPANVRNEIVDVWGWDSTTQNWTYYSPDPTSPFQYFERINTMDAGKGYWVNMNSSQSFTIRGVVPAGAPSATVPLVSNWNVVGVTGMDPFAPDTMYPTAVDIWKWDASTQRWAYFSSDPNTPYTGYEPIATIQPGEGVWVNI